MRFTTETQDLRDLIRKVNTLKSLFQKESIYLNDLGLLYLGRKECDILKDEIAKKENIDKTFHASDIGLMGLRVMPVDADSHLAIGFEANEHL